MKLETVKETKTFGLAIINKTGNQQKIAILSGLADSVSDLQKLYKVDAICIDGRLLNLPIDPVADKDSNFPSFSYTTVDAQSRNEIPISLFQKLFKHKRLKLSEIVITVNDPSFLNKGSLVFGSTSPFGNNSTETFHFANYVKPCQLNNRKIVMDFTQSKTERYLDYDTVLLLSMPESHEHKHQQVDIYITLETGREFFRKITQRPNWLNRNIRRLNTLITNKTNPNGSTFRHSGKIA